MSAVKLTWSGYKDGFYYHFCRTTHKQVHGTKALLFNFSSIYVLLSGKKKPEKFIKGRDPHLTVGLSKN